VSKVKFRTSIAVAGAAPSLGAGVSILPAGASTDSVMHELRFTSVPSKTVAYSKTTGAVSGTDLGQGGKVIGFYTLNFTLDHETGAISSHVAVDTQGGFIYGALSSSSSGQMSYGRVTGGTGAFRGARGTFAVKKLDQNSRTAVTIRYTR
jgi:hypothetical protein